jgi:hypothetical protein
MTITYEPASVLAVTLSGGNLTGSNTSAATAGCKGDNSHAKSSNKWYFEITFTGVAGGSDQGAGIGLYTASYSAMGNNATGGFEVYLSGNVFVNGGLFLNMLGAGISAGHVIAFAVDLDNLECWVKDITAGGNWNNSGTANPATNTGGNPLPVGAYVPFLTWGGGSTGQAMTANLAGPMVGTIPAHFLAWDTTPPPPPRSYATVMS